MELRGERRPEQGRGAGRAGRAGEEPPGRQVRGRAGGSLRPPLRGGAALTVGGRAGEGRRGAAEGSGAVRVPLPRAARQRLCRAGTGAGGGRRFLLRRLPSLGRARGALTVPSAAWRGLPRGRSAQRLPGGFSFLNFFYFPLLNCFCEYSPESWAFNSVLLSQASCRDLCLYSNVCVHSKIFLSHCGCVTD